MGLPGSATSAQYRVRIAAGRRARARPLRRLAVGIGVLALAAAVAGPFLLRSSTALPGDAPGLALWRFNNDPGPWSAPWNGAGFDADESTAPLGAWRIFRGAASPSRDEAIVVGIAADKTARAQKWNGSSWAALPWNPLADLSQAEWWGVDVAYESQSGDAVVVWGNGTTGTQPLSFAVWNGSTWQGPSAITTPLTSEAWQVDLAADPTSDEMVLVVSNKNKANYALVWSGSAWGNGIALHANSGVHTDVGAAYEQQSGRAVVVYGENLLAAQARVWNGSSWSAPVSLAPPAGSSGDVEWVMVASDPGSDRILLGFETSESDVWFGVWDGGTIGTRLLATGSANTKDAPNAAVGFESVSGQGLAVWGVGGQDAFSYATLTGTGWDAAQIGPALNHHATTLSLVPEPGTDQIMVVSSDEAKEARFTLWSGSAMGTSQILGTDTADNKYQPSLFLWNPNSPPVFDQDRADRADAEGDAISLANPATDSEGDPLTWSASGLPDGLSIDPATGVVSGAIASTAADGSPFAVTIRVEDPMGGFDLDTFAWTVTDVPVPPTVVKASSAGGSVLPGDRIAYKITVGNIDSQPHVVDVADPLPAGTTYVAGSTWVTYPVASTDNVRDDFNTTSYSGSTGSLPWASAWQEIGENDGPSTGQLRVSFGDLNLFDGGYGIVRQVDLSAFSSADLTYRVGTNGLGDGTMLVEASSDSVTWTTIDTVTSATGAFTHTLDMDAFAGGVAYVRYSIAPAPIVYQINIDYVDITGVTGGAYATEPGGAPPALASGYTLEPGEYLEVTFQVDVDTDPGVPSIDNTASVTTDLVPGPTQASTSDLVANRPPAFDRNLGDRGDAEGSLVSLPSPATDPDGDLLAYSATGLPPGLSIDPATGLVSGTVGAGAAAGSPYATEIRATDPGGLSASDVFEWTVVDGSVIFQQGVDGFTGTEDNNPSEANPSTSYGTIPLVSVDLPGGGDDDGGEEQGLVQFLGIVGSGAGQIPPGSTINAASLQVTVFDPGGGQVSLHPMLIAWDEGDTWDSLGNGVARNDVEASSAAEAVVTDPSITGQVTIPGLEGSVQAWVDGAANHGWALFSSSTNGWDFRSSEYSEVAQRPRLLVDYTPNASPVFGQDLLDRSGPEGAVISLSAAATDPESDGIAYAATGLPPGLAIDPATGLIGGTITFTASGGSPYAVEITATDQHGADSIDTFTWTVTDSNRAPVVVNPGNRANNENQAVTFAVSGSDPDGDALAWSATGLPDGLSIDPTAGVISGTLTFDSAGVHAVTVRATDPGGLFDEVGFTWTVANVNRGPQVVHPGHQTVSEGDFVSIAMVATDPDGDGFTWSATGLPPGLAIDPVSGLLSGTVAFGAADASPFASIIEATDDGVPTASGAALVDWTVLDVNQAPVVTNPGAQSSSEGDPVTLPIAGSDPDGDAIAWSATGLPAGLTINPVSGTISGIVDYSAAAGSPHAVVVTATDDGSPVLATQAAFTWAITDVNRTPVVTDPGTQSDAEGDAVLLAISGTDPDGDTLTWTAAGLPPGLVIYPASGEISGALTFASAGTYPVAVRATDDGAGNLFHEVAFVWDVADTNRPPSVVGPGDQSTAEGDSVGLTITASDPDGDGLVWSATGLPPGLSIDPATGEISGDITFAAAGGSPYSVTVTATDDGIPAEAGSAVFAWTVVDVNRAPMIVDPGYQVSRSGEVVALAMSAVDPEGDGFTWSATGLPGGLSIDPLSGEITGTVVGPAAAVFMVTVQALDDGLPAAVGEAQFMWLVSDDLAIAKVSDAGGSAAMGQLIAYTITVDNPGPTTHTGVAVTDALPAGTTWVSTQATYPAGGGIETVGDGWETADYAGNTGSIPWSGPWVETNDDDKPDGGKIHLHRHDGRWLLEMEQGEKWITRTADLSGFGSATLSYEYRREKLKDVGDAIVVEVSPDGVTWTEVARHAGPGTDEWQVKAPIDISEFLSATTSVRFRSLATHNEGELRVDWVEITGARRIVSTGPGGSPPNLMSGVTLLPGETMTIEVLVRVDDPLDRAILSIDNSASVTSDQQAIAVVDSTSDAVNHGPLFDGNRTDRTDAENDAISLPNPATDPNGDALAWSAAGLPDGLGINPSTGEISGTIDFDAAASSPFAVTLRVEDPAGVFDLDSFLWTVTNTNRAPFATSPGAQADAEGSVIVVPVAASDPDGDGLAWSAVGLPDGLTIDPSTGVISGTIGYFASAGSPFAVTVRVTDDGVPLLSDEVTFSWDVANTNRAPLLTNPGDRSSAEGDLVALLVAGSDPDGDPLTWSASGLPTGLSLDPATGLITGTIDFDASPSSPFSVMVRATDNGSPVLLTEVAFAWTVADTNRAPALVSPGDRASGESDVIVLPIPATDPDGDTLTWSATGLPPGLSIDPATGLITGTVSFDAAAGSPFAVTVTVTDDRAPTLSDQASFSWLVANTNRAPIVAPMAGRESLEGESISLTATGADPDGDGITWSATGLPAGLAIDAATGTIAGTISFEAADDSPFTVMVTATDDGTPSLWTTVVFSWAVADVNRPPMLSSPGSQASAEGDTVVLDLAATDPDGDTLTWSATGLPPGLVIDPNTGRISGTIPFTASPDSPYAVTVRVTDDRAPNLHDDALFTWTVANTNRAPIVTGPGNQTTGEGESVSLAVAGTDPDGDRISWSATGLPPGLSINLSTGIVTGTTGTPGVFSVTITATDDGSPSLSASVGLSWTVTAAEVAAPVIEALPDRYDLVGEVVTIHPVALSPDGLDLIWSFSGLPAGIVGDPGTGEMAGTLEESGVFEVGVRVTDSRGLSATAGFVWTVGEGLPIDEPPRAEDDRFDVIETELVDGQVVLDVLVNDSDPEGSELRITWLGDVPVGEAWITATNTIAFRPPVDWLGTTEFSYVVADAAGNTDTARVTVTIAPDFEQRAAGSTLTWGLPEAIRPTSVIGVIRTPETELVVGSIIQSLHVLRMPLTLLGAAVIWSLLLGGAFNLTLLLRGGVPFLSRKARVPLAIVMARHGQRVPAHTDPGEGEVIHRFVATAKGIAGTGRYESVDGVEWAQVDTPEGRGWVETIHLTEHIDSETFAEDPAPRAMVEGFVDALRRTGDLSPFLSRHGLWVSHHDDPVHYGADEIEHLLRSSDPRVWKGRNPAYPDVRGSFSDVVAASLIQAWDQADRAIAVDRPWVPSTIIPIEYTNLHTLSIGADRSGRDRLDQTAWLVHFSYERNTPYLIALTREG